jgi:hypothetical protein
MKPYRFAWGLAFLFATCGPTVAQPRVEWRESRPNLWIAIDQNWGPIRFSALKFHLGYYKVELVDLKSYREKNLAKIRALSDNRKFSNELLDSGIEVIYKTWPDQENIVAAAQLDGRLV